ncbi:MAG: beta-lactamase family protein, partial [Coriobacteriia bacterium]|nr:beta-lactamase family protein [Coriobacteriia bacterium]
MRTQRTRTQYVFLIVLILVVTFPFSACTVKDIAPVMVEKDIPAVAAGEDVIMSFYEQYREYAASVGIAMIEGGNTELYYLGDLSKDSDYVFDWGSCTKVITWVSVMQLVEQGRIDLDADIRTYLPEGFLTRLKYDEPITMLNLMNHNAGFQEMNGELFAEDSASIPPLGEVLKDNQPPQIRKPGEVVSYSNYGVALAGYVVECVSGQDYGDYVISHIFNPLGMERTAIKPDHSDNQWVEDQWVKEKCYWIPWKGEWVELGSDASTPNPLVYGIYGPAGSACGTIEDFSRFVKALIPDENNKCPLFEKDSTFAQMYQPTLYYADGTPRNAHGMWAEQLGNGLFGHGGNSAGFSSHFLIDPVAKKALVVMTNAVSEVTFNHKLPPVVFGDYNWGDREIAVHKDISGNYNAMRGYFPHGFLKISRFLDNIPIERAEQDNVYYLFGDENLALTQVSDRVFVIHFDGMSTYYCVTDNGVLQSGADELHPKTVASHWLDWGLYQLFFMGFFLAVAVLLVKAGILIVQKIRKQEVYKAPKERCHLFSLGCSAAIVLLLMISVNLVISNATIAVLGVLGSLCAVAAFALGILQVKTKDARLRTKALRVLTLVVSAVMLTNVLY